MPTKITKRTVNNAIVDSLFDARGYTDNEQTALKRIIADLEFKGVEYTMSKISVLSSKRYKQGG